MKIAVVGSGYVGLSLAVLLAQNHQVIVLDVITQKISMLNDKKSPIVDREIEDFLTNRSLNLTATLNKYEAYNGSAFVIVATPTDYDTMIN